MNLHYRFAFIISVENIPLCGKVNEQYLSPIHLLIEIIILHHFLCFYVIIKKEKLFYTITINYLLNLNIGLLTLLNTNYCKHYQISSSNNYNAQPWNWHCNCSCHRLGILSINPNHLFRLWQLISPIVKYYS